MTSKGFRFLRPYLCRDLRPLPGVACRAHLRFYSVTRSCNSSFCRIFKRFSTPLSKGEVQQRVEELRSTEGLTYPRIGHDEHSLVCKTFYKRYSILKAGERDNGTRVVLHGRVQSFRSAGSKLAFIDLVEDGQRIQGLCNFSVIGNSECSAEAFRTFQRLLHRGDILSVTGVPYRSNRGELSIEATELPKLLSPCLHHLPEKLEDKQVRVRNRHTDLLVNQQSANVLRLRSQIIQNVRQFLLNDGFMEVETPILADSASGAIARAFKTTATEFPLRRLSLRIAPELWLKRLVMGGFDRVFEIGRSFRNEGLDLTHNPEFTMCEFYKAYADLEELIGMTEALLERLANFKRTDSTALQPLESNFALPFKRIDFIPAIQSLINRPLPELTAEDAPAKLLQLFDDLSISPPTSPTLPRLLDKLSSHFLEPQCTDPTFIIHHPECLSPLSKSFLHPTTNQLVSARAELFVKGREIINTYEEENSPFEQRRKFTEQLKYRDDENEAKIDESYLEALEWGLPPTGGWGCGIDRLCMLFAGTERIGDVLSFGTLRNVVGLG